MGVEKEVVKAGTGAFPKQGQNVTVHCTGYGKNGDLNVPFWSTKDAGQKPFSFKIGLGNVIKGWDEGVMGMQVGEVARLKCSPDYGYGTQGFPAWGIKPNSELIFEIEVLTLDHQALLYHVNKPQFIGRVQEFDIVIIHKAGQFHVLLTYCPYTF